MIDSTYITTKSSLKSIRYFIRRLHAEKRWGKYALTSSPSVFGNSLAKSGSHLLHQILVGLTNIGPFVDPGLPPVNRDERNKPVQTNKLQQAIDGMKSGEIRYGYLPSTVDNITMLCKSGRATINILRDPRDVIISHILFATDMYEAHDMRDFYRNCLSTMEERINATIIGVEYPDCQLSGIRKKYDNHIGWMEERDVLIIKFEEIINNQDYALSKIISYLKERGGDLTQPEQESTRILKAAIQPKKSGTFRKGKSGGWREHFTEDNKRVFKEQTGNLLTKLGYETDDGW